MTLIELFSVRQQDNGPTKLRHWFAAGQSPSLEPECLAATPYMKLFKQNNFEVARQWSNDTEALGPCSPKSLSDWQLTEKQKPQYVDDPNRLFFAIF